MRLPAVMQPPYRKQSMRSIFVYFRRASRAEVARFLDACPVAREPEYWMFGETLYVSFYDDAESEFAPEALDALRFHMGRHDIVAVVAHVSGRIDGLAEVTAFCRTLLSHFEGVAMDDYSEHPWTLDEILSGHRHDGHAFFDYRGWHASQRGHPP